MKNIKNNLKDLLNKHSQDVLGYLLFDESTCTIFSVDNFNDVLNSSLTNEYLDFTYVNLDDIKSINDILSKVDKKSEICEVRGYLQYLEMTRDSIKSIERKNTIYLPLKIDGKTIPYELKIVKFEEEELILCMITQLDAETYDLEKLYADSYKDQLTGLFNKNALNYHFSKTYGDHYIGFMDIDKFKSFNDKFSHTTGDQILKSVGQKLISIADEHIIFYRCGGDEFAFMTNNYTYDETVKMINKISTVINSIEFFDIKITFSYGFTFRKDKCPEYSIEEALSAADIAMYNSKQKGTNQVTYISPKEIEDIKSNSSLNDKLQFLRKNYKRYTEK